MPSWDEIPETQFTTLGEDRIAYQVFGEGDVDLIFLTGSGDCIDLRWDWPPYASFLHRLAAEARVIMFDQRGLGASDAPSDETIPSWERWADDARAVLDAIGSERVVLLGQVDAGATAILFAVAHPARTRGLILANTTVQFIIAPENAAGGITEETSRFVEKAWGTEALIEFGSPDAARDPAFRRWQARSQRLTLTRRDASALLHIQQTLDVRDALASVRVPTLVLHREGWKPIPLKHGQYVADHIPGARFARLPGNDAMLYPEPMAEGLRLIEEFLSGLNGITESDRALAAILFTDIVESTARASTLGDREWRHLLETHDAVARTVVEQHRGKLIKTTGDGMLATFDGPGRAIRCAMALGEALRPLGLEIRAGLHTGEVEVMGADIAGIGVHIAARVLEAASPGDLVVSAAVPMLVAGSGFDFDDMGEHELKGVSGTWRLHRVVS